MESRFKWFSFMIWAFNFFCEIHNEIHYEIDTKFGNLFWVTASPDPLVLGSQQWADLLDTSGCL